MKLYGTLPVPAEVRAGDVVYFAAQKRSGLFRLPVGLPQVVALEAQMIRNVLMPVVEGAESLRPELDLIPDEIVDEHLVLKYEGSQPAEEKLALLRRIQGFKAAN